MGKPKITKTVSTRAVNVQPARPPSNLMMNFDTYLKVFDKNGDKAIGLHYLDGFTKKGKDEIRAWLDSFIPFDFLYPNQHQILRDKLKADLPGVTFSDTELNAAKDSFGVISLDVIARMIAARIDPTAIQSIVRK